MENKMINGRKLTDYHKVSSETMEKICKFYEENSRNIYGGTVMDDVTDGDNVSLKDFGDSISKSKATFLNAKKRFLKDEQYEHWVNGTKHLYTEVGEFFNKWLPQSYGKIFNHFNKMSTPKNFDAIEVAEFVKESGSSNIYSKMAEPTDSVYKITFEIGYPNPKVVEYYIFKNTTLSMRDICSFM